MASWYDRTMQPREEESKKKKVMMWVYEQSLMYKVSVLAAAAGRNKESRRTDNVWVDRRNTWK